MTPSPTNPLSEVAALGDLTDRTHQDHWIHNASTEQRLRAEAAIISTSILRAKGLLGSTGSTPDLVDITILADWIIDGPTVDVAALTAAEDNE